MWEVGMGVLRWVWGGGYGCGYEELWVRGGVCREVGVGRWV